MIAEFIEVLHTFHMAKNMVRRKSSGGSREMGGAHQFLNLRGIIVKFIYSGDFAKILLTQVFFHIIHL